MDLNWKFFLAQPTARKKINFRRRSWEKFKFSSRYHNNYFFYGFELKKKFSATNRKEKIQFSAPFLRKIQVSVFELQFTVS